jgi:hypothetical protein
MASLLRGLHSYYSTYMAKIEVNLIWPRDMHAIVEIQANSTVEIFQKVTPIGAQPFEEPLPLRLEKRFIDRYLQLSKNLISKITQLAVIWPPNRISSLPFIIAACTLCNGAIRK